METFGLILLVVGVCSAKNLASRVSVITPVAGPPDTYVTIDNNEDITGAITRVNVRCNSNQVILSLQKAGSLSADSGRIQIGDNPTVDGVTCLSPELTIPDAPTEGQAPLATFSALAGTCGGSAPVTGVNAEYKWTVRVTEVYTVSPATADSSALTRPARSSFEVTCRSNTGTVPELENLPPVASLPGGELQSVETITFNLVRVESNTNPRVWELSLTPVNPAALRGLSVQLADLTATAEKPSATEGGDPTTLSAKLVIAGCIRDTAGVKVTKPTGTDGLPNAEPITITVARFQFSDAPEAVVSFTATVTLCTPQNGNSACPAVAGCGSKALVNASNTNLSQNSLSVKADSSLKSSRARRSLNYSSLGLLTAKLV